MPTKIPAIGSSNWGNELNNIFNDTLVSKNWAKGVPGTDFEVDATAYLDPRSIMHSDVTFFVSPTGNDTNDGLSASTSFATPQRAVVEATQVYQFGGHTITIQISDGTYDITGGLVVNDSDNIIILKGNTANKSSVKFLTENSGVDFKANGAMIGLTLEATAKNFNIGFEIEGAKCILEDISIIGFDRGVNTTNAHIQFIGDIDLIDNNLGCLIQHSSSAFIETSIKNFNFTISQVGNAGMYVTSGSSFIAIGNQVDSTFSIIDPSNGKTGYGFILNGNAFFQPSGLTLTLGGHVISGLIDSLAACFASAASKVNVNNSTTGFFITRNSSFFNDGTVTVSNTGTVVDCVNGSINEMGNLVANVSGNAVQTSGNSFSLVQNATVTAKKCFTTSVGSTLIVKGGTLNATGDFAIYTETSSSTNIENTTIQAPSAPVSGFGTPTAILATTQSNVRAVGVTISQGLRGFQADYNSSVEVISCTVSGISDYVGIATYGSNLILRNSNANTSGQTGLYFASNSTGTIIADSENSTGIVAVTYGVYAETASVTLVGIKSANILATTQLASAYKGFVRAIPNISFGDFGTAFTKQDNATLDSEGFIATT